MGDPALFQRVCDARAAYNELGNEVLEEQRARFVRNPATPLVHDANLTSWVRAETDDDIDAVLARADELYAGLAHRKVMLDPGTPAAFEARLVLDGYEPNPHVELVLEGDLLGTPPPVDLRPVEAEGDWRSLAALWRLDHDEEAAKGHHDRWPPEVTEQMVVGKRLKAPGLRFWLARVDGSDAAFFSSWPGHDGLGLVEDLFTRPELRRRGIATALIAHAVGDARERGAGPVAISARAWDTPKHMYAALGFRPSGISRNYLRTIE
ncbi:MAG: GNAT family N-acetyltransferase [Acidimicrobiia bacterium]